MSIIAHSRFGNIGSFRKLAVAALVGVCLAVGMARADVVIDETNFPDANFRSWLLQDKGGYGADDVITDEEIAWIQHIDVSDKNIASLVGIEHFVNLRVLYCNNNQLTSLDVSALTNLTWLSCHNNQLTELNVSGLTNLTELGCANNQLTELDVSGLTNLTELGCANNQLTELDVSGLTNLTDLQCGGNPLTSLNVSGLTMLEYLSVGTKLTSLDVSTLTNLKELHCSFGELTSLDVSALTNLEVLYCHDNKLTALDVSGLTKLRVLGCYNNELTQLNVSGAINIENLSCDGNKLTTLDVSALTKLIYLFCDNNLLTTLDVSALVNLHTLGCANNLLTTLDVSALVNLHTLGCDNNLLTTLDVSALTNLTQLSCGENYLTSLDLSALTNLTEFYNGYGQRATDLSLMYDDVTETYTQQISLDPSVTFDNTAITYTNGILRNSDVSIILVTCVVPTGKAGMTLQFGFFLTYEPKYPVTFGVLGNGSLEAALYTGFNYAIGIESGTEVISGQMVGFHANPDNDYRVKEWKVNGVVLPNNTDIGLSYVKVSSALSVTVEFEEVTSILTPDRTIPTAPSSKDAAILPKSGSLSFEVAVGPNPVQKSHGAVNIFASGKAFSSGTLTIHDAAGNVVRKVSIKDNKDGRDSNAARRIVGVWDLKDAKGRAVGEGSYLVRGTVKTVDGKRERVSVVVSVR